MLAGRSTRQRPDSALTQPGKPGARGLGARQVSAAPDAEQTLLGRRQPAVRPDRSEGTGIVSEEDWLFHTGQWAQCARATQDKDGCWSLYIDFEKADKPLTQEGWEFDTIDQCKPFVGSYFEALSWTLFLPNFRLRTNERGRVRLLCLESSSSHAARRISTDFRTNLLLDHAELEVELDRLTDHYTDELFAFQKPEFATVLFAVSRSVVDPERFEEGAKKPIAKGGRGVICTRATDSRPLQNPLTAPERAALRVGATTDPITPNRRAASTSGDATNRLSGPREGDCTGASTYALQRTNCTVSAMRGTTVASIIDRAGAVPCLPE